MVELDAEALTEPLNVPGVVFAGVVVRKVGGVDIGDGFLVDADDLQVSASR